MEDSQKPVTNTVSKRNRRPVVITILILSVLVIAFAALYFTAAFGGNKSLVTFNKGGVCKDAVATYNAAFTETEPTKYASKLADSAKAAAEVKNNQSDANCVYIQFTNSVNTRNKADTAKFLATLESLHADGEYVTGQLVNPMGLEGIKTVAGSVTSTTGNDTDAIVKGNG